jgi:hypothetical protein
MSGNDSTFLTFVMSETTLNQIKVLPIDTQLKFFWAVANYGITGTEPDFTGLELAIWIPMRDLILHTKRKDEKWHNSQKEHGKKGAEKRWGNKTPDNSEPIKPNGDNSHNDNDNVNDNEKEKDNTGYSFDFNKHSQTKEDATAVFNRAVKLWNDLKISPQCRDIIIPPAEYDILRTFQNYSWLEIENSIKNYKYHIEHPDGWKPLPGYTSIYGFLKAGTAKYFDDKEFEQLFKGREK